MLYFHPRQRRSLLLYTVTSPQRLHLVAAGYTEAIVSFCESFCAFPHRGTLRDDVRPGLRLTNYKKRTMIAFDVDDKQISTMGIFYGGQDYETFIHNDI